MSTEIHIQPRCLEAFGAAGLATVPAVLAFQGGEIVAQSRTTSTVRLELDGLEGALFLKRYVFPTPSDRLRGAFRGTFFGRSKARAEWENLGFLAEAGIPVPEGAAFGEDRKAGVLRACFLVTCEVSNAVRLDRRLAEDIKLGRWAGYLAARMHGKGYRDGSLALRNLLLQEREGQKPVLFKVDCPKGRDMGRLVLADRAKDLGVLVAGIDLVADVDGVEHFFRAYFEGARPGPATDALRQAATARSLRHLDRERARLEEAGIPLA